MTELIWRASVTGLTLCIVAAAALAQEAAVEGTPGARPASTPSRPSTPPTTSTKPGEAKPGEPKSGQPSPAGPQPAGKEDGTKTTDGAGGVVSRPSKAPFTVDPKELDIEPVDGKVRFNFHGQPWQGVLEWLARISALSLDWQELPGDHLNLRTQREYTLDEARDLINQHLLARGFTMLRHGEVLTVVNLSKLDPALVPQVEPSDLHDRDLHEFVQTTFALDWLPAETAEEELKPLMSPKGKLTKLTSTNRLHAIDVVANLLAVRDLLAEEQSGRGRERLVRAFRLEYARAVDVKELLEEFLGIDKKGPAMPMDPNQARMMQQQMQQMQQMQQQGGKGGATAPKKEAEVAILANPRENEIIAQAPPETMAIIEQTVRLLDAAPDARDTLDRQLTRIRVFRLAQLDPETLVQLLNDMGGLDPLTKLTADKKNNSILVNGPLVDHVVVQQVIERLDGSDREFDVIRLRRLPADYVAGTIRFMLGGEDEKKEDDSYRRYYYYYDPYGSRNQESDSATGKFRVDADVQNNRLLIWANEIEKEEIHKLLVKLGEIRPDEGNRSTVRVLNLDDEQATEFLRRLEENWAADESHPLVIDPSAKPETKVPKGDPFAPEQPAAPEIEQPKAAPETKPTVTSLVPQADSLLLAMGDEDPPTNATVQVAEPELGIQPEARERPFSDSEVPSRRGTSGQPFAKTPVTISRARDGRLVVTSEDPRALDALEDLMYELAPPPKDYHVFKLKYPTTYSYYVAWDLEEFFGVDEEGGSSDSDYWAGWYGFPRTGGSGGEDTSRLSQRRKLKFIPNEDSRTIIVQGASPEQLKTIGDLIELYDQPQSQNSGDLRITKLFNIKHSDAETIANAVKDVYRDLLSSNDRALQGPSQQGEKQAPMAERSYTYVLGGGDKEKNTPEAPIKFKGLLSIGVDKESNTLVVSASTSLMDDLTQLIQALDTAAKEKEAVSVVRTGGGGVPRNISGKLKEIFGDRVKIVGEEDELTPSK